MTRTTFAYIPSSHLDLYWLGSYRTCLDRGAAVIKDYLDRCLANPEETFLIETVVFTEYFLDRYPEYREPLRQLVDEGRIEIGTVFVDRWEHLILGESHIRNIQVGAAWSEAFMGRPNRMATHPDLPGLVAQTSQIYAQAGVTYYVTSRKAFEHGAVWRHRAPDGTELTYLNWPKHYIYFPIEGEDLPARPGWAEHGLDVPACERMFPLGVIPVAGSGGDLTDTDEFAVRYGATLEDLVAANREKYPQYEFTYTIPSTVLAPYEAVDGLPSAEGDIPSVWGVACDEEVAFFRRNRQSEYQLLAAETLAVVLEHLGLPATPEIAQPWQGRFYESAFFASKDPIPAGREFAEVWKMHLFTEDHNGGGYEAALSAFQKRMMQQRVLDYTSQIIDHGLAAIGTRVACGDPGVLAFNPLGQAWQGALQLDVPAAAWATGLRPVGTDGQSLPVQVTDDGGDTVRVLVETGEIPSVGYRHITFASTSASADLPDAGVSRVEGGTLTLTAGAIEVGVDGATGAITRLRDRTSSADWGRVGLGAIRAIRETWNDVTLRTNDDEAVESTLRSVSLDASGPLFSSIRIEREILGNAVDQVVSLWHDGHVELETRVHWSGAHNWQLRMALPTSERMDDVSYGGPFHGSGWTDVFAGAAPRNVDEVTVEDYGRYREVQEWLHIRNGGAGLLQVTTHPGFCFVDRGLEAVLLRTSPSCGDTRFFWENAGEQVYRFAWFPTNGDWRAAGAIARAQQHLRPPVTAWVEPDGAGSLPAEHAFLGVSPTSAVLSSLSRNVDSGDVDIRVFESQGTATMVTLNGPLVEGGSPIEAVDLRGRRVAEAAMPFDLPAWRIQTFARREGGTS